MSESKAAKDDGASAARRRAATVSGCPFDLKSPDLQSGPERFQAFAELRRDDPVYWNPESDSSGFWAITRYNDVVAVVQDAETFSADVHNGGMRIFNIQDVTVSPRAHLLSLDPPRHTQFRKVLQPLFAPGAVRAFAPGIAARAQRLVSAIAAKGKADFVADIAIPMTLGLLVDLLDVPEEDAERLLHWSNVFVGDDDPDYQATLDIRQKAVLDMDAYVLSLLEARKTGAGGDFISLLARVRVDGEPLDFDAFTVNFGAFVIAGNETTRHALSAAMLALNDFPAEKQRLIEQPELIPAAAKELIRWATPLMHVRRTAMRDTELGGQRIAKGDKVVVWYSSANRDRAQWPDADRLDVCRFGRASVPQHLGFGAGVHHCLGWRYAEWQMECVLRELLWVLPDVHVAAAPRILRSNFIAGIKSLPIAFTPRQA
ncbi:cytochrome P450 [Aestuariivirga sp.]|uniref:cytochrome P450 n=1 Tax=Aestuariivirga sp. TaxID=2650926 RepID=UPI0039E49ED9